MQLYGVPSGILYGQNERVDELNQRIQSRQFSDKPLAPNFSPIPVMTKYAHFPALARKAPASVPIKSTLEHNVQTNFSPATHNGPPNTYLRNVDLESSLRNQSVALQRGITQGIYVPHSSSDLYKVHVPSKPGPQPHMNLFEKPSFNPTIREQNAQQSSIGKDQFYNHTRVQLRNL